MCIRDSVEGAGLNVLRQCAEHGRFRNTVVVTQNNAASNDDVAIENAPISQHDVLLNDAERADFAILTQTGRWMDDGKGMDTHVHFLVLGNVPAPTRQFLTTRDAGRCGKMRRRARAASTLPLPRLGYRSREQYRRNLF